MLKAQYTLNCLGITFCHVSHAHLLKVAILAITCLSRFSCSLSLVPTYTIERVTSKERALDVRVFRGHCATSANELINLQIQQEDTRISSKSLLSAMTKDEAINSLMMEYDSQGRLIGTVVPNDPIVQFVACSDDARYTRTNGVVGSVDAQVRRPHMDENNIVADCFPLPSPYVYLADLEVHVSMREKGVGTALVSEVVEFANAQISMSGSGVMLNVDSHNESAIRIYQRGGFHLLDYNGEEEIPDGLSPMVKVL